MSAPAPELAELGVVFSATLVKPFTVVEHRAAIDKGLRVGEMHDDDRSV